MSSKKTPRTLIGDYMDVVSAQIVRTKPNHSTSLTNQSRRALGKDRYGETSSASELSKEETPRPKVGFTVSQPVYSSNVSMHLSHAARGNKSVDFDNETPRFYIQRLMQNATPKTPKVTHPKTTAPDSVDIPVVPDTFTTPSPFQSSDSGDFDIDAEEIHYHYNKNDARQKGKFHLNIPQEMEQMQQKSYSKHSKSEYQTVRIHDVTSNEKNHEGDLSRVASRRNQKFSEVHHTSFENQDSLNSQRHMRTGNLIDISSQRALKGQTRSFLDQDVEGQFATGLDASHSMSSRDRSNVRQNELLKNDCTERPLAEEFVSVSQQANSAKRNVTVERNVWQDVSLETMNISPQLSRTSSPITNIHVTDGKQSIVKDYFMTSGSEDSDRSIVSLNPHIMSSMEAFQHLNATGHESEILQSKRQSSIKSLKLIAPEVVIPIASFVGSNEVINIDNDVYDNDGSKEISSNISGHSYTESSPRSPHTNIMRQSLEPDSDLANVSTTGNASYEIQTNRSRQSGRKSTGGVDKVAYPLNSSFGSNNNYDVTGGISEFNTSRSSGTRIMHTGPKRSAQNSNPVVVMRTEDLVDVQSSSTKNSSRVSNQGIPTTSMVDLSQRKTVNEVPSDQHKEMEVAHEEEARSSTTVKAIARQKRTRKPRMKSNFTLPVNTVKKHFIHYTNMKVSKEAVEEVMNLSERYWNIVCADLEAYARHAGRIKITQADIELLFNRQGHVTQKQSLDSLIAKYLPMEEREKLIFVARAGNRLEPTL